MKYFYKLLLSMVLLVTVSLSVVEYVTVSSSLNHSFQRTMDGQMTEHLLMKHAIQSAMLNTGNATVSDSELQAIAANTAQLQQSGGTLRLETREPAQLEPGTISYAVEHDRQERYLVLRSCFSQQNRQLMLVTKQNITSVFSEAELLQQQYTRLYLVVLAVCILAALGLSYALTRNLTILRNTSKALTTGRYDIRAEIKSQDEVGELAQAYNDMAQTIQRKIEELEESNARQGRFVASFAHELKTPMTSIIGYADTIYQKDLSRQELQQAAWYIMNEGMRLEALSFKLMDLQALQEKTFTLEQTEITTALEDAASAIQPAADERGIRVVCQAEPGWVRLEYDLFKTLLLNLLDNAIKSGTDRIELTGKASAAGYTITVRDYGRGIPPEDLDKITEAFYMVDKSRSRREHGAGLGLALCVRIAQLHGTELHYDSTLGSGTAVTMTLAKEVLKNEQA